jgi:hypothetical protein
MIDPQPGPNARVVGRGRISIVPVWALILLIGVTGIVVGGTVMALLVGVPLTVLGVFGFTMLIRARVWVDGPVLYSRRTLGYKPPVRLDQLRSASLNTNASGGRELLITAKDGTHLRLDATNLRLVRLYEAMAEFIGPFDPVANELLQKRMGKYR